MAGEEKSTFQYDQVFEGLIDKLHREGRYRVFANLKRQVGTFPEVTLSGDGESRQVVVWCSNDYLGMGHHDTVLQAMHDSLDTCGAGSGGTRNIAGNHETIVQLETGLAALHDKEAALAFSSGYVANVTALSTLAKSLPDCVVFSDSENHASMIQGIRGSKSEKYIFEHNDLAHLERLLKSVAPERPKLIAFESVYSMSGDFGPIEAVCDLADQYNALTYLDETHGVGLYGHKGGGYAQELGLTDRIDVLQGGLGKGYGVVGGFVTGSRLLIDVIRSYGTGFIFTTSLPPVIAAGALASIQHLMESSKERSEHQEQAREVKEALSAVGLPILNTESHIVPLMVGNSGVCKSISDFLLEQEDIYIQPINYPTVPAGTERLRITPTPLHTKEHILALRDALLRAWSEFELPLEPLGGSYAEAKDQSELAIS